MKEPYLELEDRFGEWMGYSPEQMVACATGTEALHLALEVLDIGSGGLVIVPDFTMIACARAVTMAGLECRFLDCRNDLLLDPQLLKMDFAQPWRTKAVMPVHIYGRRCDMDSIHEFTGPRGLVVVEDMAEAHGVKPDPRTDAACWSFYRNKIIAGEEGGMIAFKDPDHAEKARRLRSLGFTPAHNFVHEPRGINARLSNAHARLVLGSLARAEENLEKRRIIAGWYDAMIPDEWRMPVRDVVWVYDLRIAGMTTDEQDRLVARLQQQGIAARHGFQPMSSQQEYRVHNQRSPNAYRAAHEVIYLPVGPDMAKPDIDATVEILLSAAGRGRRGSSLP